MARKNTTDPTNLRSRIRAGFAARPGREFRPSQVATALRKPAALTRSQWTQKVASECARLARTGVLERREQPPTGTRKTPVAVYAYVTDDRQPERTT